MSETKSGKRPDGRAYNDMRPVKMQVGVLKHADGSAYVEFGKTHVYASVHGPKKVHPRHMEDSEKAILRCRYNMIPFSVNDRKRPGYDRRSVEIAKVISESLQPMVFLEEFPKSAIDIDLEITQADAGTRVAALTAASLALADAGIPMRDMVAAVAAGRANGKILLDLTKEEEDASDAVDMPVAMTHRDNKVMLLQMDGDMSREDLKQMLIVAKEGCAELAKMQKAALREKYKVD